MIQKIGAKRALVLMVLGGLAVFFIAVNYLVLEPKTAESLAKLNTVMGETSVLRGEVDKMRVDYTTFEKQKSFYETIRGLGFFNDQDRVIARERFDTMQKLSKIISARYEIKAANLVEGEGASATGFVVMESPITVTLSAIDDLDVYRFIYYLNYGFPGHITISNLAMERKVEVTPGVLKQIGTGSPPEIISAKMDLEWRTMARKEDIAPQAIAQPDANAAGGVQ
jgi:hypothetical protein